MVNVRLLIYSEWVTTTHDAMHLYMTNNVMPIFSYLALPRGAAIQHTYSQLEVANTPTSHHSSTLGFPPSCRGALRQTRQQQPSGISVWCFKSNCNKLSTALHSLIDTPTGQHLTVRTAPVLITQLRISKNT